MLTLEVLRKAEKAGKVVFKHNGRWYIAMGKAGFNSPANNRNGYPSEAAALDAHEWYRNW